MGSSSDKERDHTPVPVKRQYASYNKQETPTWRPRTARGRALRVVLLVLFFICVFVQLLTLLPNLVRDLRVSIIAPLRTGTSRADVNNIAHPDPSEEFKDDIWPIRQPTPWDISTDYPYPRTLEYDVEEGTWLRLDVHPTTGEVVFDMLGDLYCLPATSYASATNEPTRAQPILLGVPHDSDPRFSPSGDLLVFRSDAELGIENIWAMPWTGCSSMSIRPNTDNQVSPTVLPTELREALVLKEAEEDMLAQGVKEIKERKTRRLVREGRASAQRVTNETYRWISDARFHPSGTKLVATKWYTSTRSLGAGEGWEYELPSSLLSQSLPTQSQISPGSGKRLVGRTMPPGWSSSLYEQVQIGPEQFIWSGEDTVIYSKNVIDQGVFLYSKDVHQGIYAIFSKNLTSGVESVVQSASPGGASRPELSRDGKTLAFIRRVRDKEVLVLRDLASGTVHYAWDGLTYDLSIVSAPMGTYPTFAFTQDDSAIIIWAAGKLWHIPLTLDAHGERVAVNSQVTKPRIIPFKAHIEKKLADTVRTGVDLIGLETNDEQRLHAFKGLATDEKGEKVVFEAAGVLYYQSLTSKSKATQIPVSDTSKAYYSPSFVPNTQSELVVFAQWSDTKFSSLQLSNLSSGSSFPLSGIPFGRYTFPTICECNGSKRMIAFLRTGGDVLTGKVVAPAGAGLYTAEIELPSSSALTGTIDMKNIQFVAALPALTRMHMRFFNGNEKLLVEYEDEAFTIDIGSGPDAFGKYGRMDVVSGQMAQEISVALSQSSLWSHDANAQTNLTALGISAPYVAVVEGYNVYAVPSKNVGAEPIWAKPGNATKGIARLGLDGGHDIRWSRDGTKLIWLLGPYLHSLEISKLSQCESEIARDSITFGINCVKDLLSVHEIQVSYKTDSWRLKQDIASLNDDHKYTSASTTFAITNASLLTMETGRQYQDHVEDATILIRNGVIDIVGPSSQVVIPADSVVYNAEGGFVLPGFIDVHAHWSGFPDLYPSRSWEMATFLAYGVTTLHNPSSDNVLGFVERGRVENGGMIGPRIFHTGNIIYGASEPAYHLDVADMDEAYSALVRIKVEGGEASFSYKNYNQPSRAARQRLLLAARNLSMLCFPEGGMNYDWDLTYIADGMTTIEHAIPVPELYDDVLTFYALSGTGATPTHLVNYGGAWGEQLVWEYRDVPNDPKLRRLTREDILETLTETTYRPKNSYALFNTSSSIAKMVKMGLKAHIGAHGEAPLGLNYHAEMFFTQSGGLSNYETFRAATIDSAITLGLYSAIGSLSPGKLADLVIYPPGVDLLFGHMSNSLKIKYVVRGGRVWNAEDMIEVWPSKGAKFEMPPINVV